MDNLKAVRYQMLMAWVHPYLNEVAKERGYEPFEGLEFLIRVEQKVAVFASRLDPGDIKLLMSEFDEEELDEKKLPFDKEER